MEDFSKLTKAELIEKLKQQNAPQETGTIKVNESEDEFNKLQKLKNNNNPNALPYTIKNDHKNIMLYTALNKRVGALHPDNAESTMRRWKAAGIQLYTTPRTDAQIEAFKKTPEYIKAKAKHDALRKQRHQQSSKGKAEKMIAEVAKQTAVAVAQVNKNG